jgi:hypothetical protein
MNKTLETTKFVYWQDDSMWLRYLEQYPEYRTQGETKEKLEENLRDIHSELTSGSIRRVRRVDQLEVGRSETHLMREEEN